MEKEKIINLFEEYVGKGVFGIDYTEDHVL